MQHAPHRLGAAHVVRKHDLRKRMLSQPNRVRTATAVDRCRRCNPTGHSVSARSAVPRCCCFVCLWSALPVGTPCCFALWPLPPVVTVHGAALPAQAAACCALVRTAHLLAEEGAVGQNLQALWTVEDLAGQRRPIRASAGRSGIAVQCSGARQETLRVHRGVTCCVPLRHDAMRLLA